MNLALFRSIGLCLSDLTLVAVIMHACDSMLFFDSNFGLSYLLIAHAIQLANNTPLLNVQLFWMGLVENASGSRF